MPDELVTAGSFDQMRTHIAEQLTRIADDNALRLQLIQEEIDRRFTTVAREFDLRLGATISMREQLATETHRRFTDTKAEMLLRLDAFTSLRDSAQLAIDERIEAIRRETVTRDLLEEELTRRLDTVSHDRDVGDKTMRGIIGDLSIKLDERYATQTKALDKAFDASAEAVRVALENAEKAVNKAESSNNARFASVNEFRAQLADQTASFITRNEYALATQNLTDTVTQMRQDLTRVDGKVVPRDETDAWRAQLTDKLDTVSKALTERTGALELRLTSRLDLGDGRNTGTLTGRDQQRLNISPVIAVVAVLAAITTTILLALKK